jgi:hypothetical protein
MFGDHAILLEYELVKGLSLAGANGDANEDAE